MTDESTYHTPARPSRTSCVPPKVEESHVSEPEALSPGSEHPQDAFAPAIDEPVVVGRDMLLTMLTVLDSIRLFLDLMETKNRNQMEMIRTIQSLTLKAQDSLSRYVPDNTPPEEHKKS